MDGESLFIIERLRAGDDLVDGILYRIHEMRNGPIRSDWSLADTPDQAFEDWRKNPPLPSPTQELDGYWGKILKHSTPVGRAATDLAQLVKYKAPDVDPPKILDIIQAPVTQGTVVGIGTDVKYRSRLPVGVVPRGRPAGLAALDMYLSLMLKMNATLPPDVSAAAGEKLRNFLEIKLAEFGSHFTSEHNASRVLNEAREYEAKLLTESVLQELVTFRKQLMHGRITEENYIRNAKDALENLNLDQVASLVAFPDHTRKNLFPPEFREFYDRAGAFERPYLSPDVLPMPKLSIDDPRPTHETDSELDVGFNATVPFTISGVVVDIPQLVSQLEIKLYRDDQIIAEEKRDVNDSQYFRWIRAPLPGRYSILVTGTDEHGEHIYTAQSAQLHIRQFARCLRCYGVRLDFSEPQEERSCRWRVSTRPGTMPTRFTSTEDFYFLARYGENERIREAAARALDEGRIRGELIVPGVEAAPEREYLGTHSAESRLPDVPYLDAQGIFVRGSLLVERMDEMLALEAKEDVDALKAMFTDIEDDPLARTKADIVEVLDKIDILLLSQEWIDYKNMILQSSNEPSEEELRKVERQSTVPNIQTIVSQLQTLVNRSDIGEAQKSIPEERLRIILEFVGSMKEIGDKIWAMRLYRITNDLDSIPEIIGDWEASVGSLFDTALKDLEDAEKLVIALKEQHKKYTDRRQDLRNWEIKAKSLSDDPSTELKAPIEDDLMPNLRTRFDDITKTIVNILRALDAATALEKYHTTLKDLNGDSITTLKANLTAVTMSAEFERQIELLKGEDERIKNRIVEQQNRREDVIRKFGIANRKDVEPTEIDDLFIQFLSADYIADARAERIEFLSKAKEEQTKLQQAAFEELQEVKELTRELDGFTTVSPPQLQRMIDEIGVIGQFRTSLAKITKLAEKWDVTESITALRDRIDAAEKSRDEDDWKRIFTEKIAALSKTSFTRFKSERAIDTALASLLGEINTLDGIILLSGIKDVTDIASAKTSVVEKSDEAKSILRIVTLENEITTMDRFRFDSDLNLIVSDWIAELDRRHEVTKTINKLGPLKTEAAIQKQAELNQKFLDDEIEKWKFIFNQLDALSPDERLRMLKPVRDRMPDEIQKDFDTMEKERETAITDLLNQINAIDIPEEPKDPNTLPTAFVTLKSLLPVDADARVLGAYGIAHAKIIKSAQPYLQGLGRTIDRAVTFSLYDGNEDNIATKALDDYNEYATSIETDNYETTKDILTQDLDDHRGANIRDRGRCLLAAKVIAGRDTCTLDSVFVLASKADPLIMARLLHPIVDNEYTRQLSRSYAQMDKKIMDGESVGKICENQREILVQYQADQPDISGLTDMLIESGKLKKTLDAQELLYWLNSKYDIERTIMINDHGDHLGWPYIFTPDMYSPEDAEIVNVKTAPFVDTQPPRSFAFKLALSEDGVNIWKGGKTLAERFERWGKTYDLVAIIHQHPGHYWITYRCGEKWYKFTGSTTSSLEDPFAEDEKTTAQIVFYASRST